MYFKAKLRHRLTPFNLTPFNFGIQNSSNLCSVEILLLVSLLPPKVMKKPNIILNYILYQYLEEDCYGVWESLSFRLVIEVG